MANVYTKFNRRQKRRTLGQGRLGNKYYKKKILKLLEIVHMGPTWSNLKV